MAKMCRLDMGPAVDSCFAVKVKQEIEEEELDCARAQEKDRLTNVLGLMKTVLLPRFGDLIGWRQKNRLRKPKPTNYSLIKLRNPPCRLPGLSSHPGVQTGVSPSDKSMQSKGTVPDVLMPCLAGKKLRRSVRTSQARKAETEASEAKPRRTRERVHQPVRFIKTELVDPVPVAAPFSDPPPLDRVKRQTKPPIKLLDSGFQFSFCQPARGTMAVIKKEEEESLDICPTPSQPHDSKCPQQTPRARRPPARRPPARRPPARPPAVSVAKREWEERSVSQSLERRSLKSSHHVSNSTRSSPGRARLKQIRGPQTQAPNVPSSSHSCVQCEASYKDCEALIMHRLRHVEGKHWPCPLCCKKFFRMRNVRNHIRTHEPQLYKCWSCIVAGL